MLLCLVPCFSIPSHVQLEYLIIIIVSEDERPRFVPRSSEAPKMEKRGQEPSVLTIRTTGNDSHLVQLFGFCRSHSWKLLPYIKKETIADHLPKSAALFSFAQFKQVSKEAVADLTWVQSTIATICGMSVLVDDVVYMGTVNNT